jgi:hypothetical protein
MIKFTSPLTWAVVAVASVVVGFVSYRATKSDAKDASKDPISPAPPDQPEEGGVIGDAEKSFKDENGILWALYRYQDGSWEGTPLDAEPKYVQVFHEPTIDDLKAMIKGHAAVYNPDGTLKTGAESGDLPPYIPGQKCGAYACWILADPTTATPVPPNALTTPLAIGDIVAYYLADEVDVKDATYLAYVTAQVTGNKIETIANEYGSYPIRVINATMLHGKQPTKLPPIGYQTDQWRFRMVKANLIA